MRGFHRIAVPLLVTTALLVSCGGDKPLSSNLSDQSQTPSTGANGASLPLTQDSVIPAVPDPVEVYVMKADGGNPRLVAALSGVPMWAWSSNDDRAALITDITDHSAEIHVISVKAGTDTATADIAGYPGKAEWSPTGEWLAWKSGTQDGSTLEAMRADGSDRQELASVPGYGAGQGRLERLGGNVQPSLMYMCSGAGNGTRTRDSLLWRAELLDFTGAEAPGSPARSLLTTLEAAARLGAPRGWRAGIAG